MYKTGNSETAGGKCLHRHKQGLSTKDTNSPGSNRKHWQAGLHETKRLLYNKGSE